MNIRNIFFCVQQAEEKCESLFLLQTGERLEEEAGGKRKAAEGKIMIMHCCDLDCFFFWKAVLLYGCVSFPGI